MDTLCPRSLAAANKATSDAPKERQASIENQRGGDTQDTAATIAAAIRESIRPAEKDAGCQDRADKRDSDLCAQWKAADAARDAADYSFWALLVGIAGTAGVVATLYYTRKAVIAAEEATKDADNALEIARQNAAAATEQVEIARQAHVAQFRPWVFVETVELHAIHMQRMDAIVVFKNYGNWPAKGFAKGCDAKLVPYPFAAEPLLEVDRSLATLLPPSSTETMSLPNIPINQSDRAVRIRIAIAYMLPDGTEDTSWEDFMVDKTDAGRWAARKVTGYDSASHPMHRENGG